MHGDDRLTIDTPEQIALELPIAGIGSRFLALTVDTLLQGVVMVATIFALVWGLSQVGRMLPSWVSVVTPPIVLLFLFCVYWGYFAFFEIIWSGRTPGKRMAGIRVIKDTGRPINAYEAVGRNVVRAVDMLPGFYAIGVLVMLFNRQSRRLGDYVAGTLVVHDRGDVALQPTWDVARDQVLPSGETAHVSVDELELIETYLRRRFDLDESVRDRMAEQIAARIFAKTGLKVQPGQSLDEFLQGVAKTVRDTVRYR